MVVVFVRNTVAVDPLSAPCGLPYGHTKHTKQQATQDLKKGRCGGDDRRLHRSRRKRTTKSKQQQRITPEDQRKEAQIVGAKRAKVQQKAATTGGFIEAEGSASQTANNNKTDSLAEEIDVATKSTQSSK